MKKKFFKVIILFLIIIPKVGFSQTGKNPFPLSSTVTKVLIDSLASKIEKYYIFNDSAFQMTKPLGKVSGRNIQ